MLSNLAYGDMSAQLTNFRVGAVDPAQKQRATSAQIDNATIQLS